jgi:hypothetical protein
MIDKPRDLVMRAYRNPECLPHWYEGFISLKPMMKNFGMEGTKAILCCKREDEIVEVTAVVESVTLPDSVVMTFEQNTSWYRISSKLYEVEYKTKWIQSIEFHFSGLLALLCLLNKKRFISETYKKMNRFKKFAEHTNLEKIADII